MREMKREEGREKRRGERGKEKVRKWIFPRSSGRSAAQGATP